jgi:thymidylate kinase
MNNTDGAGSASPAPPARFGKSVALIGVDGAGKSTVAKEVVRRLPMDAEYLYMGVNLEASPVMLPTTRLALAIKRRRGGRTDMTVGHEPGARTGPLGTIRRLVRMANWLLEEAYRAALARRIQRRPATVVFDRHFFCDYYAGAIAPRGGRRTLDVRIHGYVLDRWYPRPDLVLFLDAPTEILIARKAGTPAFVTQRRAEYLDLVRVLPAFQIVDVDRPAEEVAEDVTRRIVAFLNGETAAADPEGASAPIDDARAEPATEAGPPTSPELAREGAPIPTDLDDPTAAARPERAAAATVLPPADAEAAPTGIETIDEPESRLLTDARGILPMDSTSPAGS